MKKISYTVHIPTEMYLYLQELADKRGVTIAEVLRCGCKKFILFKLLRNNKARLFVLPKSASQFTEINLTNI